MKGLNVRLPRFTLFSRSFKRQGPIVYLVWGTLAVAFVASLVNMRWSTAFIAASTLLLSFLPVMFVDRFQITLPVAFFAWIALFIFGTIFLGEALNFYERYWWWDLLLHAGSAMGFGLVGFLFAFMLFQGDRYAAPPIAIAFIAYCIAVTIGTTWEIFEFLMDYFFGLNMQKSGLYDTMSDLMVDAGGASIGATAGFFYLKGREFGGLAGMIDQFVRLNLHFFKKHRGDKK